MAELSAALSAAQSALTLDQTLIGVTGNNIANLDNPNFARRQAQISEQTPLNFGRFTLGTGVQLDNIVGVRDRALNLRIAAETSDTYGDTAFVSAMSQVEQYFPADGSSGIASALNQFWSSWQALAADPSNNGSKQQVFSAAQDLASAFRSTASGIAATANSAANEVQSELDQANGLLGQLAKLNGSSGTITPEISDQQDQIIGELSKIANISVVRSGAGLSVSTASGVALVSGTHWTALQSGQVSGSQAVTAGGSDVTQDLIAGSVGGNLKALNQALPALQSRIDTLASSVATAVNTAYGANFFQPSAAVGGSASSLQVAVASAASIQAGSPGLTGDNSIANALADLRTQPIVVTQTGIAGLTAADYHSDTVFQLGEQVAGATAQSQAGATVLAQMQQQQQAIEGVSLDSEAANLMQYQRAYSAAARVITTVDQMMQTAIGMGANV